MRRDDLGSTDGAHAAVGRKDDDRGERRLERAVEVSEALDVEHVHLPNEGEGDDDDDDDGGDDGGGGGGDEGDDDGGGDEHGAPRR